MTIAWIVVGVCAVAVVGWYWRANQPDKPRGWRE